MNGPQSTRSFRGGALFPRCPDCPACPGGRGGGGWEAGTEKDVAMAQVLDGGRGGGPGWAKAVLEAEDGVEGCQGGWWEATEYGECRG